MSISELRDHLKQISLLQEAPEEFCDALAEDIFPGIELLCCPSLIPDTTKMSFDPLDTRHMSTFKYL